MESNKINRKLFSYTHKEKYKKLISYFPFFALLPWIRKPGTQTMTKVEGYHITKPSASQMKFCVFACCSATEQRASASLCKAVRIWSHLCAKKRNILQSADPLLLGGKLQQLP